MAEALTGDELAQLRALGPTRYRQQVGSLFASGQATAAQWQVLASCLRVTPEALGYFRDRWASTPAWQAIAAQVLLCSESDKGALVSAIDRAILTRHAAHEAGRDAWGRWQVG